MIRNINTRIATGLLVSALFNTGLASAEPNKVVVIPLQGEPAPPANAYFTGGNQGLELTNSISNVRNIVVPVSGKGTILASISGTYILSDTTSSNINCSLRADGIWDIDPKATIAAQGAKLVPFAATRGFTVTKAGTRIVNFVCKKNGDKKAVVSDTQLTALFIPE